jgi:ectoine hydroxylase-related dioxygenase (phytanoyl-CoA dioxygenase family)
MQVNPQQILDDGFVVLREVVPPSRLEELRSSFEQLVDRQRAIWARDRKADDPPGGAWETSPQPRLVFNTLVDRETANTAEFCLHENTMGVSRQLMRAKEAAITAMFFMCSPVRDHGPARWHRDIHPIDQAPLRGLETDLLENAPGYIQWNIPLYDDSVLWVVPGSHRRANTEAENRSLQADSRAPLPGSIPVELKAGDGVCYTNTILHWGSNYSARHRRTIHLGYRSFGGPIFPYVHHLYWDLEFTRHLSPEARQSFERFARYHSEERDRIESIYRAMLSRDAATFREDLAALHPGEKGRMVTVVLLAKIADKIRTLKRPDVAALPPEQRAPAIREHITSLYLFEDLARRFSDAETDTLWQRFATLDARLQADTDQYEPGFQSGPMRYLFN